MNNGSLQRERRNKSLILRDLQQLGKNIGRVGVLLCFFCLILPKITLAGNPAMTINESMNIQLTVSMSKISGDNQQATIGTRLTQALVVKTSYTNGTGVSGLSISFTITSQPQGATGTRLSANQINTNAQGQASVTLTLGSKPGQYKVSASNSNVTNSPLVFTATAIGGEQNEYVKDENPDLPIRDYQTTISPLTITDNYGIGSVSVYVDISHTYIGDLIVTIISPSGGQRILHSRSGGTTDDIRRWYENILEFAGENVQGRWQLKVEDNASQDTGSLNLWKLKITKGELVNWQEVTYNIDSPHPYPNNYDNTWMITCPGASKVKVHFSKLDTERGFDFVYIYDKNNQEIVKYTGYRENFWSTGVSGDTIKIRLKTDYSITRWGFNIDKVARVGGSPPSDIIPPAAITNLQVTDTQQTSVTLSWNAPGDDGNAGTAMEYDIRYSTSLITEANWSAATQCANEPQPLLAGTRQNFQITGLTKGTIYYFAIKTRDEVPTNWSLLSNVVSEQTTSEGVYVYTKDEEPNSPILDYQTTISKLTITDNYWVGTVSVYIDISHTYIGDLIVTVISPSGNQRILHNRSGGDADDIRQKYENILEFAGENIQGIWQLKVEDKYYGNTGSLNLWKLKITKGESVNWQEVTYNLDSPHPCRNNYDNTWGITCPGAIKVKVHFTKIETESNYDFVGIYDKNDQQIDRYSGKRVNFWSPEVVGDTIKIRLWTDIMIASWGFNIDKVSYQGGNPPDNMPPAAITNLQVTDIQYTSVTLSWIAPGDDGNLGTATEYDIRYSTAMITDANWNNIVQCQNEPAPRVAGTPQTFTVTSLQPATQYYFAMKTKDEVSNWSGLSNVVGTTTPPRLDKVGIYYHNNTDPTRPYPYDNDNITVKAIVWANDGAGTKTYCNTAINNDGYWYCAGTDGPLSEYELRLGNPDNAFVRTPTLPANTTIYQWPTNWQTPSFNWTVMYHYGSSRIGNTDNRNYWYATQTSTTISNWGTTRAFGSGTTRYRVTATLGNQSVSSQDKEYATRISVRSSNTPQGTTVQATNYLRWLTAYLETSYEWGGVWFGGKTGNNVGGPITYDGYGIDCARLVCAGARFAGYNWNPWYGGTSFVQQQSDEITSAQLQPGDILNKVEDHATTVYEVDRSNPLDIKVWVIEAAGGSVNKVRRSGKKDLQEDYIDEGYSRRRLR